MIHANSFAKTPCALEDAQIFLKRIYRYHGLPSAILCDQDPLIMSRFRFSIFVLLKTKIISLSAFYTETDGHTKIVNRNFEKMISAYAEFDKSNWNLYSTRIEIVCESSDNISASTSLFYLNCSRHPRVIPSGTLDFIKPAAARFI